MAEAEEIRSRIETIKDLSDRLAEQDRTIKDLEEEMRSETPEHPWSFMKMRRNNRLHAEIEDEQTSMSRDRYDLNCLTERLFEDVNIIADKATSTNSLELILDLVEQSLDTDPNYRENVRKQAGVTDGMSYMRLVIEGASQGVPMVGSRGDVPNESEVFLPDLLHCTVLEETTDGTYLGKRFERIYRLGVDSEETPVPKRELLEFPSIQSNVPLPDPAIDQDATAGGPDNPGLEP